MNSFEETTSWYMLGLIDTIKYSVIFMKSKLISTFKFPSTCLFLLLAKYVSILTVQESSDSTVSIPKYRIFEVWNDSMKVFFLKKYYFYKCPKGCFLNTYHIPTEGNDGPQSHENEVCIFLIIFT